MEAAILLPLDPTILHIKNGNSPYVLATVHYMEKLFIRWPEWKGSRQEPWLIISKESAITGPVRAVFEVFIILSLLWQPFKELSNFRSPFCWELLSALQWVLWCSAQIHPPQLRHSILQQPAVLTPYGSRLRPPLVFALESHGQRPSPTATHMP